MKDWQTVQDSRVETPPDLEITTSTVYERRNVHRVTVGEDEWQTECWEYEQREYSPDEWERQSVAETIMKAISGLELAVAELKAEGR